MTTYTSPAPDSTAPEPVGRLDCLIHELTTHLHAETCRLLGLLSAFDRKHGWADHDERSCAAWLSRTCGLSPSAAREHVRVAWALEGLPEIHAAFSRGELSYDKVRALTRIATPETDAELASMAVSLTPAQVERACRRSRKRATSATGQEATGLLTWRQEGENIVLVEGRLTVEQFEALRAGMTEAHDAIVAADDAVGFCTKGVPEHPDASAATHDDAGFAGASPDLGGGHPEARPDAGPSRPEITRGSEDLVWVSGRRTGRASVQILIRMLRVHMAEQEPPVARQSAASATEPTRADVAA